MDSQQRNDLDPSKKWAMVAYTDGGAVPNPGAAGMGLHAYFYDIDEIVTVPKIQRFVDGETVRYALCSDAGYVYCSKDGVISSAANKKVKLVNPVLYAILSESSSNQHSNNYAEMKSFLNALRLGRQHNVERTKIITDSEYALKGATTWCESWSRNGWRTQQGEPVKNADLWKVIHAQITEIKQSKKSLDTAWVKGHNSHPGNTHADTLATVGVVKSQNGIDDETVHYFTYKEWWEPKKNRHPLLSLKRLYFNRHAEKNIPGFYMMADPGKEDNLIGKPLAETVFAIVYMNEPDPILDAIQQAQYRYGQDFNRTMMVKMDTVFQPHTYNLIQTFGPMALHRQRDGNKNSSNLVTPDGTLISIERNPVGITMRAIDSINSLEAIFETYLELSEAVDEKGNPTSDSIGINNNRDMRIVDITDNIYDLVEKKVGKEKVVKKVLKKDIVVGQKTLGMTITVNYDGEDKVFSIPLKLGLDIMDRNSLKQLETSDPMVNLITWRESSNSMRYATVIRCDEGVAIWSNFYADRLVLKNT